MGSSASTGQETGLEIAVVGMAGRFPGASNIEAFWHNLCAGVESITFFSEAELLAEGIDAATQAQPSYVKAKGVLDDVEYFDAPFFDMSHREAEVLDPQHRLFLESAFAALEDAGYDPQRYKGAIGVFAGTSLNSYLLFNLYPNAELMQSMGYIQMLINSDKDFLTTRASYKLNLEGPSLTVQTACSTSLVAAHLACQSLLNGECDIALAGGITVSVPQRAGYWYQEGSILSPDGHCRAFDAQAQGTVFGSGVGLVVLKRLQDALDDGDTIHAVIKGSAINNDGGAKAGYTAPRIDGQAKVIRAAQLMAEVEPETIGYIEAHGTGTPLGDPIEIAALNQVFQGKRTEQDRCALGTVKSNVGHLDAAAGIAGLIKAILVLKHGQIPPSLHFTSPNPAIDFASGPFYVNTQLRDWDGPTPRRAGVSSFGIGGTNAHLILEEPPAIESGAAARPWQLLPISAKTEAALDAATRRLARHLSRHPELNLADVAYTLQVGRQPFGYRRALVCSDRDDALRVLTATTSDRLLSGQVLSDRPVAFLFPGQGAQYVNMGRELYEQESMFQAAIDECAGLLRADLGLDLRTILYPEAGQEAAATEQLTQTQLTQPALFVIEYALARLWQSWGVQPQAMIGHSVGEYVAATLAGVFSLEDALMLVAQRGKLMQSVPPGAMLSVSRPAAEIEPLLTPVLSIAAINGPQLCVVSGPSDGIAQFAATLAERDIEHRRLHTSHAFHSAMLDPIVEPFIAQVARVTLNPPQMRFISNVTGTWITEAEATDPRYWGRQLRQAVNFAGGLDTLLAEPEQALLEVGPGRTLSTFARQHPAGRQQMILQSLRHPQERIGDGLFLALATARLWLGGVALDWQSIAGEQRRLRVPLPTYPFERQRYWIDPPGVQRSPQPPSTQMLESLAPIEKPVLALHQRPPGAPEYAEPRNAIERHVAAIWQQLLGVELVGIHDNFFELGGHSLMATQMVARLQDTFPVDLPLGALFEVTNLAELAELIETLLIEKIEALPEDEAQQLVAEMFG
jgi:phthiocerol/phenolphthiocerol synthesis type-I polyketide synthase E